MTEEEWKRKGQDEWDHNDFTNSDKNEMRKVLIWGRRK